MDSGGGDTGDALVTATDWRASLESGKRGSDAWEDDRIDDAREPPSTSRI